MEVTPTTGPGGVDALGVGANADGSPLWTYVWGASRRPFVHPLTTPSGVLLTTDAPDDHPWHHALWFAIKFVDGDNFWEEYDAYGVIRHRGRPEVVITPRAAATGAGAVAEGDPEGLALSGDLDWIRPDRQTVAIVERRTLVHRPLGPAAYGIDITVELRPNQDVVLDRTPFTTWGGYGGLTVRGAPTLIDTTLLLDGERVERCLGDAGRWVACVGTDVASGRQAGFAVATHPSRPESVPWYASTRADTYGPGWANFVNAAFLWDGPRRIAAGETLALAYRVIALDGPVRAAELERWVDAEPTSPAS